MKLSSTERNSLPSKSFVFPNTRKYPIENASHARNALSRAAAQGPDVESKVKSVVARKFPSIGQSSKPSPFSKLSGK